MGKFITKTSLQARLEKEKDTSNICPECGDYCIGTYITDTKGLFKFTHYKKNFYKCLCGCEWETGWRES